MKPHEPGEGPGNSWVSCGSRRAGRVLDVACGKAEFLCLVAEAYNVKATGIDLSPHTIEAARKNVENPGACPTALSCSTRTAASTSRMRRRVWT